MQVEKRDGSFEPLNFEKIERLNQYASKGLNVNMALFNSQMRLMVYDRMKTSEIFQTQIKAAAGLISREHPEFTFMAARFLLAETMKLATGKPEYDHLKSVIEKGEAAGRYSVKLGVTYDLDKLNAAIKPERDFQFDYLGLQNVVDRYLMRDLEGKLIELPQQFLMRVAMGLALNEDKPNERAIEFYELLSGFDGMMSTPTLFNSGTIRSQLSSCYLNIVNDQISSDLEDGQNRFASIYGTIEESARLSKYAGGIGTSWTRVRGAGAPIVSTNGKSSGVVPYLKVYNDTALAVNQGGKRKGSFAPYLEPWHPDFWDFCELKKEFGDERMRAHDIYPASWLPDLFMQRVQDGGVWSEFQPHLYPELHELHGKAFEQRYTELEAAGKFSKQRPALEVWRHILTNLFETGHPWITFKDECNFRNPQQHVGVIHSSNLCTEITLNTSDDETAVCNLGSVNMANHIKDGRIDTLKLEKTVITMMRMLDNVIDLNYYPSERARASNMKHRPVGLGMMGETEAKVALGVAFDTEESVELSGAFQELISFFAISASCDLAIERGKYDSFEGSTWSKGLLPVLSSKAHREGGDVHSIMPPGAWGLLAQRVSDKGMRNSNTMAIAPTATISLIVGTTPSIEPIYEIERDESNISGSFKVVDPCVKYGRPDLLRTAFEIAAIWVIRCAERRQFWIDQAQSVNIYIPDGTRGRDLADIYIEAWKRGLKTTYYLRGQSSQKKKAKDPSVQAAVDAQTDLAQVISGAGFCAIDNPNCESCQ